MNYYKQTAKAFNDVLWTFGIEEEVITPDDILEAKRQKQGWLDGTKPTPEYYLPNYPKIGIEVILNADRVESGSKLEPDSSEVTIDGLLALVKYSLYGYARYSSYVHELVNYIKALRKTGEGRRRLLDI